MCVAPLLWAAAPHASAEPDTIDDKKVVGTVSGENSVWKVQEELDAVVKDIRAGAPKGDAAGISGVVVDLESNKLSLYWKGALPASVADRLAEARANGIEVVVRQASYTETELIGEADRISRKPLFSGVRTGQRMMRVSPRPDGSGLDVALQGLPADVTPQQARHVVPALDSAVPLSVTATDPVTFTTRLFDTAPYWGGSYLHRRDRNSCTSAFGVTGLNGAASYLMSAAHCGEGAWGGPVYLDANGNRQQEVYGSTIPAGRSTQLDVQLIHTPAGAGSHIYWGTYMNPPAGDPGSSTGVPVRGWTPNSIGNAFCLSGSYSGTICDGANIRITGTNITITYDPPSNGVGRVTGLVQGTDVVGARAFGIVGQGDSGGPVVSPTNDGGVQARGVISGMALGEHVRPCYGYAPPNRTCSRIVYFADVQNAMATVGVRLNTSTG